VVVWHKSLRSGFRVLVVQLEGNSKERSVAGQLIMIY